MVTGILFLFAALALWSLSKQARSKGLAVGLFCAAAAACIIAAFSLLNSWVFWLVVIGGIAAYVVTQRQRGQRPSSGTSMLSGKQKREVKRQLNRVQKEISAAKQNKTVPFFASRHGQHRRR